MEHLHIPSSHLECNQGKVSWEGFGSSPGPSKVTVARFQLSFEVVCGTWETSGHAIIVFLPESFGQKICSGLGIWVSVIVLKVEMAEMRAERKWSVKGSMLLFSC